MDSLQRASPVHTHHVMKSCCVIRCQLLCYTQAVCTVYIIVRPSMLSMPWRNTSNTEEALPALHYHLTEKRRCSLDWQAPETLRSTDSQGQAIHPRLHSSNLHGARKYLLKVVELKVAHLSVKPQATKDSQGVRSSIEVLHLRTGGPAGASAVGVRGRSRSRAGRAAARAKRATSWSVGRSARAAGGASHRGASGAGARDRAARRGAPGGLGGSNSAAAPCEICPPARRDLT